MIELLRKIEDIHPLQVSPEVRDILRDITYRLSDLGERVSNIEDEQQSDSHK